MPLLAGRRLLVTGVLTDRSIAYAVAAGAQREGAEVVLTGFGRSLRLTERMARRLPEPADGLELDVDAAAPAGGEGARAAGAGRRARARRRRRGAARGAGLGAGRALGRARRRPARDR